MATNRQTGSGVNYYDFKGNVTARGPLAGGAAFTYGWDEYDRMTAVSPPVGPDVYYDYDAGGRLLKRTKDPGGSEDVTINYWLGLNKIAEEKWGPEAANDQVVFRPDDGGETGDPADNGTSWSGCLFCCCQYLG